MPARQERLFRLGVAAGEWDARQLLLDRPCRYPAGPCRQGYVQGYDLALPLRIIRVDLQKSFGKQSLSFRVQARLQTGQEVWAEVFVRGGRWLVRWRGIHTNFNSLAAAWVRRLWLSQSPDFRALLPEVMTLHDLARPLPVRPNPLLETLGGKAFRDLLDETNHPFLDFYTNAWAWYAVWPLYPVPFEPVPAGAVTGSGYGQRHWFYPVEAGWTTVCDMTLSVVRPSRPDDPIDLVSCPTCYLRRPIRYPALGEKYL